jgi:hypothetical protein
LCTVDVGFDVGHHRDYVSRCGGCGLCFGLGLLIVAISVLFSTAGMFLLLKVRERELKKWMRAKCEDASEQV